MSKSSSGCLLTLACISFCCRKRKSNGMPKKAYSTSGSDSGSDSYSISSADMLSMSNSDSEFNSDSETDTDSDNVPATGKNGSRVVRRTKVVKKVTVKVTKTSKKITPKKGGGRGKANSIKDLDWMDWEKDLELNWGPWGDNGEEVDMDALVQRKLPLEIREPPPELLMPLLPFQKEWLAWSLKQERSSMRGGILADEMGMGKTIQAISLIVTSRYDQRIKNSETKEFIDLNKPPKSITEEVGVSSEKRKSPVELGASSSSIEPHLNHLCGVKRDLPLVKATLVVCPLVAVTQWKNEIARFTAEGSMKVLVYHGPRRGLDLMELSEYDVVLTTYSIVELEHRKNVMPAKEECKWCKRHYYPDKLAVHLRFFCGPSAQRTEKQAKQVKKKPRASTSGKKVTAMESEDEIVKGKGKGKGIGNVSSRGRGRGGKGKTHVDEDDTPSKGRMHSNGGVGRGRGRGRGRGGGKKIVAEDLEAALEEAMEGHNDRSGQHKQSHSVLHSVKWGRIVLDEVRFLWNFIYYRSCYLS